MLLKVMTFNVRGSSKADGQNVWEKRQILNLEVIRKYLPDIVGFQEAESGNLETYNKVLIDYTCINCLPETAKAGFGSVAIYWKKTSFDLLDYGGFYLSETPDIPSKGWNDAFIRPTSWVLLKARDYPLKLFVLNTHFPHEREDHYSRHESAKLIVKQIKYFASDLPILVLGDFNTIPKSPTHRTFLEEGFVDSYQVVEGREDMNTFHRFLGEHFEARGLRFDWILMKDARHKFKLKGCDIIYDAAPPVYPSDHYPVLASLSLE